MIRIHYDFTDGTELSYQQGLNMQDNFTTCCLDFFSFDTKCEDVVVVKQNGEYISRNELLSSEYVNYTDKEIRKEHNIQKMLKAASFKWKQGHLHSICVYIDNQEQLNKAFCLLMKHNQTIYQSGFSLCGRSSNYLFCDADNDWWLAVRDLRKEITLDELEKLLQNQKFNVK